jgi:hypothetical protein
VGGGAAQRISGVARSCSAAADLKTRFGIGQRDDGNGYPEERFCTARHAFDVGASNSSYAGVCAGPAEDDFLHGYRLGKALAEARARRERWAHEMHRLQHLLEEDREDDKRDQRDDHPRLSNAERVEIGFQLGVAMMRRDEADRDVAEITQLSARL